MFRAVKLYDGSDYTDCIALTENDSISGVIQLDTVWYRGTNVRTGETGTFPISFVEPVTDANVQFTEIEIDNGDTKGNSGNSGNGRDQRSDTVGSRVKFDVGADIKTGHNNNHTSDGRKLHITKHAKVHHSDSESSLSRNPFASGKERLLKSNRGEYKGLKAVAGAVTGVVIGAIILVLLRYSFDYSFVAAAAIAAVFTVILSICLAASTFCRCIMALVFPNFFTGKGRAVFLSIIFGIMLSKPVTNIVNNAKETGSSMACITEMAANQSRAIQEQLAVPIKELYKYVEEQKRDLGVINAKFDGVFGALESKLSTFRNGIKTAEESIDDIVKKCEQPLKDVKDACKTACKAIPFVTDCDDCNEIDGNCNEIRKVLTTTKLMAIAQQALQTIDEIKDFFKADLEVNGAFNASAETNKSLDAIQEEVNRDITAKARTFEDFVTVTNKIVSLSLALVFIQSFWYLRNYLAKDAYDNVYITKEFAKLDKTSRDQILPLKKKERNIYVLTSSLKLGASELAYCKIGLIQVMIHFVLCCLIVIFDFALYYILSQVSKYSNVSLGAEAHSKINVEVKGSGFVADFYRIMLKGVHINNSFNTTMDIATCLPKASVPSTSTLLVFFILYLLALAFVLLRGYGMRLRRKIAAYFYPEQERERLEYLHKKIRHKRIGFLKFLRQHIKSDHKESHVKDKLRFSTWLMFNFPCLARCMPSKDKMECTSCEQKESSFHHIKMTKCKGVTGGMPCDAVYCEECLAALNNVCPICATDEVVLRD